MKRIYLITIIVAVCVLAGVLLYFFVFRSQSTSLGGVSEGESGVLELAGEAEMSEEEINPAELVAEVGESTEISATIEMIEEDAAVEELGLVTRIITGETIGSNLVPDGNRIQYYDVADQSLASVTFTGKDPVILMTPNFSVSDITWAPDRYKFVYLTSDGDHVYADVEIGEEVSLIDNISSPSFSPASDRLVYYYNDIENEVSNVSIGNPTEGLVDGKGIVGIKGDVVVENVPEKQAIAYFLAPSLSRQANLYTTDYSGSQVELLLGKDYGINVNFSPDGSKMLYNKLGKNGRPELWLANSDGSNRQKIPFATYTDKIVWGPEMKKIYMAVPEVLPSINDYYQGAKTKDRLFELYFEFMDDPKMLQDFNDFQSAVDMQDMFLSPGGALLYFRDAYDDSLVVVNVRKIFEINALMRERE